MIIGEEFREGMQVMFGDTVARAEVGLAQEGHKTIIISV